jgi:hypothetical protein
MMSKKSPVEADLDPAGTRHTRPGSKVAESAVENTKPPGKRKAAPGSTQTRPGSTAAARAVDATRRKTERK